MVTVRVRDTVARAIFWSQRSAVATHPAEEGLCEGHIVDLEEEVREGGSVVERQGKERKGIAGWFDPKVIKGERDAELRPPLPPLASSLEARVSYHVRIQFVSAFGT